MRKEKKLFSQHLDSNISRNTKSSVPGMIALIFVSSVFVFMSFATIFAQNGNMGIFGQDFAQINVAIFGYVAYVYPFLLLVPVYCIYKNPVLDFRKIEGLISFLLGFVGILLIQSLIFGLGYFGNEMVALAESFIGVGGIWIFSLACLILSLLIIKPDLLELSIEVIKRFVNKEVLNFVKNVFILGAKYLKVCYVCVLNITKQSIFFCKEKLIFLCFLLWKSIKILCTQFMAYRAHMLHQRKLRQEAILKMGLDGSDLSKNTSNLIEEKLTSLQGRQEIFNKGFKDEVIDATSSHPDSGVTNPYAHRDFTKIDVTLGSANNSISKDFSSPPKPKEEIEFIEEKLDVNPQALKDSLRARMMEYERTRPIPMPNPQEKKDIKLIEEVTLSSHDFTAHDVVRAKVVQEYYGNRHKQMPQKQSPDGALNIGAIIAPQRILEAQRFHDSKTRLDTQDFIPSYNKEAINANTNDSSSITQRLSQNKSAYQFPGLQDEYSFKDSLKSSIQAIKEAAMSFSSIRSKEHEGREVAKNRKRDLEQNSNIAISPARSSIPNSSHRPNIVRELAENKELLKNLEFGKVGPSINFKLPLTSLLNQSNGFKNNISDDELDEISVILIDKLETFGIKGDIVQVYSGPIITLLEFRPVSNVKTGAISSLKDDLALALSAKSVRIQAPVPGKNVVGIEIPNKNIEIIYLREILESDIFKVSSSPLTLALGKDIVGSPFVYDLRKLPHLLIAGTTGSGKSVGVNAMILSLIYKNSPDTLKLMMIDPKRVEFTLYEDIPYLITPIITDPKKAIVGLINAMHEMDNRYERIRKMRVRDIDSYNKKAFERGEEKMSYFVIIIDELADLMQTAGREAEVPLSRIAQMGRACGMHLIIATQRPDNKVITGVLKANLPSRIGYKVGSQIDSRVILDAMGAESLLGNGDMLFKVGGDKPVRLHAPFSTEEEIERVVDFIKAQREPNYDENFLKDEREKALSQDFSKDSINVDDGNMLEQIKQFILQTGNTSSSSVQRQFSLGFNRATKYIEQLEKEGFLSSKNHKGLREIIG